LLKSEGLHKSFGSLRVLQDVSLVVAPGSRHAVIGPNGAGKTTLFNLLSGELAADAGRISLGEKDITRLPPQARARRGLARSFQRNSLFPEMSVAENLALACALAARVEWRAWRSFRRFTAVHADAAAVAAAVGLQDLLAEPAGQLSYGAQRQVEVGLALACRPRVLLLDEPTAGMSPQETRAMQDLIGRLPRDLTVVIIEHDMDVVFSLADRITVLDSGSVLAEGTPDEIRSSAAVQAKYLGGPV